MDKAEKITHRVTVNLVWLIGGWALLYMLCWLFESSINGHAINRWSDARCGFAMIGSMMAWAFQRQVSGWRP